MSAGDGTTLPPGGAGDARVGARPLPAARDAIPHTGSCVLLERLLAVDEAHLRAAVRISRTPYSLPDGGLPGWCGLELMAQAVSA